ALYERLQHKRGEIVGVFSELLLERGERGAAIAAGRRWNGQAAHEQRPEDPMKQRDPTDADRAKGVAVVGLVEAGEPLLARAAAQLPVLERLLERDLDGGRPGIRVEDAAQAAWRDVEQRGAQPDRRLVRQPEERRVRDPVELVAQGAVEPRMAMPVH